MEFNIYIHTYIYIIEIVQSQFQEKEKPLVLPRSPIYTIYTTQPWYKVAGGRRKKNKQVALGGGIDVGRGLKPSWSLPFLFVSLSESSTSETAKIPPRQYFSSVREVRDLIGLDVVRGGYIV